MKTVIEKILDTKNGDLTVVAGKAGTGKSYTLLEVAVKSILNDSSVLLFNLELSKDSCIDRILRQHKDLKMEQLSDLIIDDTPAISVNEITSKCKELKKTKKLGIVLIDYLQLIKEYGDKDLCYELKQLSLKLEVPIIVASQLGNDMEKMKEKYKYADNVIVIE